MFIIYIFWEKNNFTISLTLIQAWIQKHQRRNSNNLLIYFSHKKRIAFAKNGFVPVVACRMSFHINFILYELTRCTAFDSHIER